MRLRCGKARYQREAECEEQSASNHKSLHLHKAFGIPVEQSPYASNEIGLEPLALGSEDAKETGVRPPAGDHTRSSVLLRDQ